jgi:hypothetical protein
MGQAAVDLPNSSDKNSAPLQSADDLLSQMAGAEIDRMLADADAEKEPEAPAKPAVVAESAAVTGEAQDAYKAEVDELFRQLDSVPLPPKPAPVKQPVSAAPPAPFPEVAAPAAEVQLEPQATAAPVEASESESDPVPTALAEAPLEPPPQEDQSVPAEENPAPAETPSPIDVAAAIEIAVAEVEKERAGLLVRILQVINAPFASCPDTLRELLGKLAILTLMNSMGVLLYIVLFRK